jgi:hypothetical protein
MVARQIHFAGWDHEVAMNEVDDAIGEIGREVGAVVCAAILPQAPRYVHAREPLGEGEFHIGVCLVVAQQDIEARFLLLDEVVLEGQSLFIIGDNDVVDVDGRADERAGFLFFSAALVEIGGDARAQVVGLAYVNHLAYGVLVEVHAG